MASRCRWPPDTLVPPCAIGASSRSGIASHEVVGLGDPQRLPHLLVGGVGLAVPEVAPDGAGEQERLLRDQPDRLPQHLGARSRTSTPSTRTSPPVASNEPRHQVDQRRLAGAGGADHRDGLARLGAEGDVVQHRLVGAGVGERHVVELERAAHSGRRDRVVGRPHGRLGVEHLDDPVGAHRGARHHHQHEGRHHHRHQDLHQVGEERGQRADLHLAAVDPVAAEPQHRHAGDVDDQHHQREHRRHPPTGGQRDGGQLGVGLARSGRSRAARGRTRGPRGCR